MWYLGLIADKTDVWIWLLYGLQKFIRRRSKKTTVVYYLPVATRDSEKARYHRGVLW